LFSLSQPNADETARSVTAVLFMEAFPKLQFWKSNLAIRGFAGLKA
jgi:hypothetical protein